VAQLRRKLPDSPDEVRDTGLGHVELWRLGDVVIGKTVFQPGWRWSKDVKPIVGTDWCQDHHFGITISGQLHILMEDGAELESGPGAVWETPPGHDAWVIGDEPWVAYNFAGIRDYALPMAAAGLRRLATLVFTDIVDSTAMAEQMGDAAWRNLLAGHNEQLRMDLERHRGREVSTTGDGFLAIFDGAERAVRAAATMVRSGDTLGLKIRAGVHSGEVEDVGSDIRGLAVHAAARICALAAPGEVLASSTTVELLAGSSLHFESRGRHALKGLSGDRELLALSAE
jgi:class 3 adenylate cyclase